MARPFDYHTSYRNRGYEMPREEPIEVSVELEERVMSAPDIRLVLKQGDGFDPGSREHKTTIPLTIGAAAVLLEELQRVVYAVTRAPEPTRRRARRATPIAPEFIDYAATPPARIEHVPTKPLGLPFYPQ